MGNNQSYANTEKRISKNRLYLRQRNDNEISNNNEVRYLNNRNRKSAKKSDAKPIKDNGIINNGNPNDQGNQAKKSLKTRKKHFKVLSDEDIDDGPQDVLLMRPVEEIAKLFVKEYIIIWYNESAKTFNYQSHAENLRKNHELKIFDNRDDVVDFIQKNTFALFVITSGTNDEDFVKMIHELDHIKQIYFFGDNVIEDKLKWTNKYRKIKERSNDLDSMINKLIQNLKEWQRSNSNWRLTLPAFQPIFDNMDMSDFNQLVVYLNCSTNFKNRKQAMRDFLGLSKALSSEKQIMKLFDDDYKEYDMKKIFKWYTEECFLYKVLNNCLRIATVDSLLYCRLILADLQQAIKDQYRAKSYLFHGIVYRSCFISDVELARIRENIGKEIQIHGFMSTTKSWQIVLRFLEQASRTVLFTILIPGTEDKLGHKGYAELDEYTEFSSEEEVLFNIMSRFRVLDITEEVINGTKHPNIVLLYGAYDLKLFMYEIDATKNLKSDKQISIEIKVNDIAKASCFKCKREYITKEIGEKWFLNLKDQTRFSCQECLQDENVDYEDVMIVIPSDDFLSKARKINGFFMKPIKKKDIDVSRLKCTVCKINQIGQKLYYRCMDCNQSKLLICPECSKIGMENCIKNDHIITIQRSILSIWLEKMTPLEFRRALEFDSSYQKHSINLAEAFVKNHNYEKALECYEKYINQELETEEKAQIHADIGDTYQKKGEYDSALEYYNKALKIYTKIHGEKHYDTARCLNAIGNIYNQKGEYDKALEYLTKSLDICQEVYGENHYTTASCYNNIVKLYFSKGEIHKALELLGKPINTLGRIFELINQGNVNRSISNADNPNLSKGKNNEGVEDHIKVLNETEQALGHMHFETAICYHTSGITFLMRKKYDQAMEYIAKSLKIKQEIFGENHPETAICYALIGSIYFMKKEFDEAIEYHTKTIKIYEEKFGENHPQTAVSYSSIGSVYYNKKEYDKAIEYLIKSIEIKVKVFGEKNIGIANTYKEIGKAYLDKKDNDQAIQYYTKAFEIRKEILGEAHSETLAICNELGSIYFIKKNFDKALEYLLIISKKYEGKTGTKDANIAISQTNVAIVYSHKKQYDKVIEYHLKALKVKEEIYGKKHLDIAETCCDLGLAYSHKSEYDKAIKYYLKALEIRKALLGETHDDTIAVYENIGSTYLSKGDFVKVTKYLEITTNLHEEKIRLKTMEEDQRFHDLWNKVFMGNK